MIEWKGTDPLNKVKPEEEENKNDTVEFKEVKVVNKNDVVQKGGGIINAINRKLENKEKLDNENKENNRKYRSSEEGID